MQLLVEACITSVEESLEAIQAGAGRLELCSDLDVGGLTPPLDLVRAVRAAVHIPVHTMVRLRAGSYEVGTTDVADMQGHIREMVAAGVDGVVLGVLDHSDRIDTAALADLVSAAAPVSVTFHRAFDRVPDQLAGLDTLIGAGVSRVLTSGGAETAWSGRDNLRRLVRHAEGRITVLGGGGVRGDHAVQLLRHTGLKEVHARGSAVPELVLALEAISRSSR
ncbi:MAG: copper homeostasis protein CutC [Longimicrobiales bacterium]